MTPRAEIQKGEDVRWQNKSAILSLAVGVSLVTAHGVGCSPEVVAGTSKGAGGCPGCFEDASYPGEGGCADRDAYLRQAYDAWRGAPNDLAELADTVWSGKILGSMPLTLVVDVDQSARFVAGEHPLYPSTDKDDPYLCDAESGCGSKPVLAGGTYPLHGAKLGTIPPGTSKFLQVVLNPMSPFDAWCHLQVPRLDADGDCNYSVAPGPRPPGECTVAGEPVSCDWLAPTLQLEACTCASNSCFARTEWLAFGQTQDRNGFVVDLELTPGEPAKLTGRLRSYAKCCSALEQQVNLEFVGRPADFKLF